MVIINFLWFAIKVLGLVFITGLLLNLILDVIIIEPIMQRAVKRRKLKILDIIIHKMANGEELTKEEVESLDEELKK